MNTEFFGRANDMTSGFSWKDIFSDVFEKHTSEQRMKVLSRGMAGNIPERSRMLDEWQKPWMFLRVAVAAVVLSACSLLMLNLSGGKGFASLVPAFAIPLSILFFYWEMNISGDISLLEVFVLMLIGGIASISLALLIGSLFAIPEEYSFLAGPIREEPAKLLVVLIIMCMGKYRYGLQGIVVGGAVGAGFAAIESAAYALNEYDSNLLMVSSSTLDIAQNAMVDNQVLRGLLALGGHTIWAALYGGALGLAKHGKKKYEFADLKDPLLMMTFSAAFVFHSFFNIKASYFLIVGMKPTGLFEFLYRMQSFYIDKIVLIVLPWTLLLFIMRKCIRQMAAIGRGAAITGLHPFPEVQQKIHHQAASAVQLTVTAVGKLNAGKSYKLNQGGCLLFGRNPARANVLVPSDSKGVSALHCEIKQMGEYPVLIDLDSTYGTFFSNGMKLSANVPYKIKGEVCFYLGAKENMFRIRLQ